MSRVFDLKSDERLMAKVAEKKKEAEFAEAVKAELARESKFFAERMVKTLDIWYYFGII